MINELNERTRQILRLVIDAYVETGEPVGSKLISQRPGMKLSPATIRAVMVELEELGLLYSPHTSAGRLPTDTGLTVFVEGLMEVNDLAAADRRKIEQGRDAGRQRPAAAGYSRADKHLPLRPVIMCRAGACAERSRTPSGRSNLCCSHQDGALAVLVTSSGVLSKTACSKCRRK